MSDFLKNSLDERAKLITAFLIMLVSFACNQWQCLGILLGVSIILCIACKVLAGILIFSGFMIMVGTGIFFYHWMTGFQSLSGMGIMFLVLKFGPLCAMVVFLYKTVNTTLFLRSLAKMRIPSEILIPLGVTLRFIPSFIEEFSHVRNALAFRGIFMSPITLITHPFRVMESILIPLLMRSLFIGEELSRAALVRGIDMPGKPVSIYHIRFGVKDTVWSVCWTIGSCLIFLLDRNLGCI